MELYAGAFLAGFFIKDSALFGELAPVDREHL
jgi:hypothetical protein